MDPDLLQKLTASLAIGAVIGVERGWKQRGEEPGSRAAGLRTFTLAGLLGGIAAILGATLGATAFAAILIAFSFVFGIFQWREIQAEVSYSATSTVAGILTFALGALAGIGHLQEAAMATVAAACILAFKDGLHAWLQGLTWPEVRSAFLILAMTFIALPVLPSKSIDPWGLVQLRELWFLTILIATLSFAGYIAVRLLGERAGLAAGAAAGSVVSSTLTVSELAGRVRRGEVTAADAAAAASVSTLVMLIRAGLLIGLLAPHIFAVILPALAAPAGIAGLIALYLLLPRTHPPDHPLLPGLRSPLDLGSVVRFALLIGGLNISVALVTRLAGDLAVLPLAAVSGLADIDAIILNVTRLTDTPVDLAERAILIAILANMASKSVLSFLAGNRAFGVLYSASSLTAALAGISAWLLT
jgi:uncharacterized membrane protein (DUF4010 family)